MKRPKSSSAAMNAPTGTASASIAWRASSPARLLVSGTAVAGTTTGGASSATGVVTGEEPTSTLAPRLTVSSTLVGLPDDALDEVVHALELDVGLLLRLARGDHDLARVVLERALLD